MGGVAGEEQTAEAHRLGDEATERGNTLFDRRTGYQILAGFGIEPVLELLPEAIIRPSLDIVGKIALEIVAAAPRRAHRAEREARGVAHINQLIGNRRRIGKNTEPAERIDTFVCRDRARRDAHTTNAVKPVATGYEVAFNLVHLAADPVADARFTAGYIVRAHVMSGVDRRRAGGRAAVHQVLGDLGLPVH